MHIYKWTDTDIYMFRVGTLQTKKKASLVGRPPAWHVGSGSLTYINVSPIFGDKVTHWKLNVLVIFWTREEENPLELVLSAHGRTHYWSGYEYSAALVALVVSGSVKRMLFLTGNQRRECVESFGSLLHWVPLLHDLHTYHFHHWLVPDMAVECGRDWEGGNIRPCLPSWSKLRTPFKGKIISYWSMEIKSYIYRIPESHISQFEK
jgi:hypothetical protein